MSCNNVNPITGGSTVDDIPFYLAVQQGKVPGYSMINKFGYNSSIGSGWSIGSYGNLSNDACNYLFNDLYNGVPNPNVTYGGGLFAREFVFNNMPNIKKTSHTFNQ